MASERERERERERELLRLYQYINTRGSERVCMYHEKEAKRRRKLKDGRRNCALYERIDR